ncbi:amidase [Mesorhizobium sp. M0659]|uniref:amidase n=1 Tax=Mesorhizobium sp. M0659 TaxID=2956980 RepID=UPI003339FAD8
MSKATRTLLNQAATGAMPVREMAAAFRRGDFTARELTAATLENIARSNPAIRAFTCLSPTALADAARADDELARGLDLGPFHGIPIALKDIYDVKGMTTTCSSFHRLDHVALLDSTIAERLRDGGAIIVGKLATYEFAFGDPQNDLPFPAARNPWDLGYDTGGSSSGSGAAVAAGLLRVAFGTDTGGSIRCPAAWCGVTGLKPTAGRLSAAGVFPLSPTLDTCGPLAKSVDDAALALWAVHGLDQRDGKTVARPMPIFRHPISGDVAGLKIAVAANYLHDPSVEEQTRRGIMAALDALARAGAEIAHVELPEYSTFSACAHLILLSEAFALHRARIASDFRKFGATLRQRLPLGAFVTQDDLAVARQLRERLTDKLNDVLVRHDAIVTTCSLGTAGRPYAPDGVNPGDWPMRTIPFNLTGHPALAVPSGVAANGLPISLQIVGRFFDEATILGIGRAIEDVTGSDRWRIWPTPDKTLQAAGIKAAWNPSMF